MTRGLSLLPPAPWPEGDAPPPVATLPELIDWQAARRPEGEALVAGDVRQDYAALSAGIRRVAAGLAALGVGRGSHVALLAPNRAEWILAAFGAHRVGAVLESFNTWVKAWDLRHLLSASGAEVLITAPGVRGADLLGELRTLAPDLWETGRSAEFPALRTIVVLPGDAPTPAPPCAIRWEELLAEGRGDVPAIASHADDVAYVLYTSGTTAAPKAVPLTHRRLIENGYSIGSRMGLTEADRVWLGSPLFWSYGCANAAMSTFGHGATLVLQDRFTPQSAAAVFARERITAAYLLPSIAGALHEDAAPEVRAVDSLRTGLIIGTPAEFTLAAVDLDIPELCNIYGSTESYGNCCVTPHTMPLDRRAVCQGPPLSLQGLRVADMQTNEVLPFGEVGEIQVRGRILTEYIGNPEATVEAITPDGWFKSGDTGRLIEGGYVQFVGRATDMIKTNGINVSPAEVESFLTTHPAVLEVGVVGAPHPTRGEATVAFVVLRDGAAATEEELIAFCKGTLAGFKVPWAVGFLDALPKTTTGKMMRRGLKDAAAGLVEERLCEGARS